MKVRIRVTREDIAKGCRCEASACPVFLACKRRLKRLYATYTSAVFGSEGKAGEVWLPTEVRRFMRSFDHAQPVKPFAFTIDVPARFVKPAKAAR